MAQHYQAVHYLVQPTEHNLQPATFVQPNYSIQHAHVLRLNDILHHLLAQPPSYMNTVRMVRAWRAIAQCKEYDAVAAWKIGAKVIVHSRRKEEDEHAELDRQARRVEWIKCCQERKLEQVEKFEEYLLALVAAGRASYALEEADSFLPSYPYHDSISLNVLAGFLALYLAQPPPDESESSEEDVAAHGSGSSSSSEDEAPSTSKRRTKQRKGSVSSSGSDSSTGPSTSAKREALEPKSDEALLRLCRENKPELFSQAEKLFRQAARLEDDEPADSRSEGKRWLRLLESVSEERSRVSQRF